jgi:hypothetical protein
MHAKSSIVIVLFTALAIVVYFAVNHLHPAPAAAVTTKSPGISAIDNKTPTGGCQSLQPAGHQQPKLMPGASLDNLRAAYGTESSKQDDGSYLWKYTDFRLQTLPIPQDGLIPGMILTANKGHTVETTDGIVLGKDTFRSVLAKAKALNLQVHERMDGPEGNWTLTVDFPSVCYPSLVSEYFWMIEGSPKIDAQVIPKEQLADNPWHSDVFLDKIVDSYTIQPQADYDRDEDGNPSTHLEHP